MRAAQIKKVQSGFTLIELVVVLSIIGVALAIFGIRGGAFSFYREDAFVRELIEKIGFLHQQAIADQAFYRLEFNFDEDYIRIGAMKGENIISADPNLASADQNSGTLSLELAQFLTPDFDGDQTMIPPPNFPSLAEPSYLPAGVKILDIKLRDGIKFRDRGGVAAITFSPRGFSEFAVIHLEVHGSRQITILVNPFTGVPEKYPGYVDFEATFGKQKD